VPDQTVNVKVEKKPKKEEKKEAETMAVVEKTKEVVEEKKGDA
jgi:hypothetical protein